MDSMDFCTDQVPPSLVRFRSRLRFELSDLVQEDAELHFEQQFLLSRFFVELATDQDLNGTVQDIYARYKRALFAFYKPE